MLLGALIQSIPDADFIAAFWNDPATNLLVHRGFTHSLFFAILATSGGAVIAEHFHKQRRIGLNGWSWFLGTQFAVHIFIDLFNNYGLGLFEPFSHYRYSFNALFVVDPLFTLGPAISFIMLIVLKARIRSRVFWWKFGVLSCTFYLLFSTINKALIDRQVARSIAYQQLPNKTWITTPTPLNNILWFVVVSNDSEYFIGFHSLFDRSPIINFTRFLRCDSLLKGVADHEELQHLIRFSQGYYTIEKWHDTLVFNNLRFGQMLGWKRPDEHFVFHYYLQKKGADNRLVVQRGRFAKWNKETLRSLWNRIRGN